MKIRLLSFIYLLLISCSNDSYSDLANVNTTITLIWNKAYEDDSIDQSLIGLKWALSYLVASLPSGDMGISVSDTAITIDIIKLGFNATAEQSLLELLEIIKSSNEYETNNTIDLGSFIALTIGASEHYYKIAGTPITLDEILNNYTFLPLKGYIDNSTISNEHRILEFSAQIGLTQLLMTTEVDPTTQAIYEYETIEILPNGQLRFGIFDANGIRIPSAESIYTNAGKPAKCMWCHESTINPLFTPQNNYPNYLTYNELQNTLQNYRVQHHENKTTLFPDGVDFTQTQQHTLTELLYISFMDPSAQRLSYEWNLTLFEVENQLSGLETHIYDEFPFLGELYHRNEVDPLAPFQGITVSSSVREPSDIEVNYLD